MMDSVKDQSDFFLKILINWKKYIVFTQPYNIFVPVYSFIGFQISQNGF